jgi:hypothetical protein
MSQLDDTFETAKKYSWLSHLQYSKVSVNHGYARIAKIMWRIVDLSCSEIVNSSKTVRNGNSYYFTNFLSSWARLGGVFHLFPCQRIPRDGMRG